MPARKTQGTELFYLSSPTTLTKVGNITGITGTGGARPTIQTTNLDSTSEEYIGGLEASSAMSIPLNFDPTSTVHQDLLEFWQAADDTLQTWVIGLSDGTAPPTAAAGVITYPTTRTYRTFQGYVADFPVEVALNSKLEGTMSIQRSGPIDTNYKA